VCARKYWGSQTGEVLDQIVNFRVRHEDLQVTVHEFVNFHNCCFITASIAVVRSTKHCDDIAFM